LISKTVQTDKAVDTRKPATAQLGGYLHGLNINRPMIDVDKCCTVVVGPGRSKVISEDPDLCFCGVGRQVVNSQDNDCAALFNELDKDFA
jgi:hypothetical protein